jgi:molecular chaperone HscB
MENYFDFYKIEEQFFIDEADLKQRYLKLSKEHHPDFFVDNSAQYQAALEITSTNNKAYKTLSKLQNRVTYILELNNVLKDLQNSIPQDFLMEMMDVNEAIMDLKIEPNAAKRAKLEAEMNGLERVLQEQIEQLAATADVQADANQRDTILVRIKENYLKLKYVLRIKESLNTFAA